MGAESDDEYQGMGGSYVIEDGKRVLVGAPTRDHPEGNRARDADGNALDQPEPVAPAFAPPAENSAPE